MICVKRAYFNFNYNKYYKNSNMHMRLMIKKKTDQLCSIPRQPSCKWKTASQDASKRK